MLQKPQLVPLTKFKTNLNLRNLVFEDVRQLLLEVISILLSRKLLLYATFLTLLLSLILFFAINKNATPATSFVTNDPNKKGRSELYVLNLDYVIYESTPQKDLVAECIAKRYRLNRAAAQKLVQLAEKAAAPNNLDANLILAIAAIESNFHPLLVSSVGAVGLMQILPSAHLKELSVYGNENNWLNPEVNMKVGSNILAKFIKQTKSVEGGLATYVGARSDLDHPYVYKVKYEFDIYNDCSKGIKRNLFGLAQNHAAIEN